MIPVLEMKMSTSNSLRFFSVILVKTNITKKLYYKNVQDEIKNVPRKFICNTHANVPFVIMVMGGIQTVSTAAI